MKARSPRTASPTGGAPTRSSSLMPLPARGPASKAEPRGLDIGRVVDDLVGHSSDAPEVSGLDALGAEVAGQGALSGEGPYEGGAHEADQMEEIIA